MRVSLLASGSKGNAALVELDGTRVLVDAGISARRIKQELARLGVRPDSLDGVLVTHEHTDHVKGLATLCKEHHLPVFTRAGTFAALGDKVPLPADCRHPIGIGFRLGKISIKAFNVPHDAADPVGFSLCGAERVTIATDIGFVTSSLQADIDGADVLVLEANHDLGLLRTGPYPWPLKRRILGNRGHIANSDAAWALARLRKRPRQVMLAHLSETNNRPDLALQTVKKILAQQGIVDMPLLVASQHEAVSV